MEKFIMERLKIKKFMDKEDLLTRMVIIMKVVLWMGEKMGKGFLEQKINYYQRPLIMISLLVLGRSKIWLLIKKDK